MVERSNRSIRIFADWCNGSTPDSDSGDESSNLLSAAKNIKMEKKIMLRLCSLRLAGKTKLNISAPVAKQVNASDLSSDDFGS